MADNTLGPVTAEDVKVANTLLGHLATSAIADGEESYTDVLRRILEADEYLPYIKALSGALEMAKAERPLGVYLGSTSSAINEVAPNGEIGSKAIRMLKNEGRILQAGRGRGKALTIISDKDLNEADFAFQAPKASRGGRSASEATPAPDGSRVNEVAQKVDMALANLTQAFQDLFNLVRDSIESRSSSSR